MKKKKIKKQAGTKAKKKQEKQEKPEQAKQQSETTQLIIIAIALVVIIVFTIFVYQKFFVPEEPKPTQFTFNGFVFTKKQELWETEVQLGNKIITMPLHYTPHQVRSVYIGGILNESFNQGPLYITFDPDEENLTSIALAVAELSINIAQGISRDLIAACSKNVTLACETRPIIDCDSNVSVIYVKHGPTPFVKLDQNCIVITGEGKDVIKAVDKLLYFWYGIIKSEEDTQYYK